MLRFIFFIFVGIVLFSCDKKGPVPITNILLEDTWVESNLSLYDGKWQKLGFLPPACGYGYYPIDENDPLYNSLLRKCETTYKFTSTTQGVRKVFCQNYQNDKPAPNLCRPPESEEVTFSWSFNSEKQEIEIIFSIGYKQTWKISERNVNTITVNLTSGKSFYPIYGEIDGTKTVLTRKNGIMTLLTPKR